MSAMIYPIKTYRYTISTYEPMECLNIDFIGPFPDKGYILVMIGTFSWFLELYATPDATTKSVYKALVEHVGRYGSPWILRSDNGPHFASRIIDKFVKIVETTHNKILPYHLEENAIVERIDEETNCHKLRTHTTVRTKNFKFNCQ